MAWSGTSVTPLPSHDRTGAVRELRKPLAGVGSNNARSHSALVARSGTRWRRGCPPRVCRGHVTQPLLGQEGPAVQDLAHAGREWFEGCYVFETSAARETFEQAFKEAGAGSPSSQIIGSAPTLIEACEIVAVAEGASGFVESVSSR